MSSLAGHVAILLVTRDNRAYAEPCLRSLLANTSGIPYQVYCINSGQPGSCAWAEQPRVRVLEQVSVTGWVEGLMLGVAASKEPALLFLNDDTLILPSEPWWLSMLYQTLIVPGVGAVGPATNTASGPQSIWRQDVPRVYAARYLIGFCLLVWRHALMDAGGLDSHIGTADDVDLSWRMRQVGYTLVGNRGVYVHHHGCVTGTRLHGPASTPGGYNSLQWLERDKELFIDRNGPDAWVDMVDPSAPPRWP